jgi:hypothetical protein
MGRIGEVRLATIPFCYAETAANILTNPQILRRPGRVGRGSGGG